MTWSYRLDASAGSLQVYRNERVCWGIGGHRGMQQTEDGKKLMAQCMLDFLNEIFKDDNEQDVPGLIAMTANFFQELYESYGSNT